MIEARRKIQLILLNYILHFKSEIIVLLLVRVYFLAEHEMDEVERCFLCKHRALALCKSSENIFEKTETEKRMHQAKR